MAQIIQHFKRNVKGRDLAVGDIHGHFSRLATALERAGFSAAEGDRLFSVGDLVDRGPESEKALEWLAQPWFHAVRGNHEDTAIRYASGNPVDRISYSANGGDWFMALAPERQQEFRTAFSKLPYAIEVETGRGVVGLVHANVATSDWNELAVALRANRRSRDKVIWDRSRVEYTDRSIVCGIRAVVVGHTPLRRVTVLGNVHHIDTGGWMTDGYFTLLDLATLKAV